MKGKAERNKKWDIDNSHLSNFETEEKAFRIAQAKQIFLNEAGNQLADKLSFLRLSKSYTALLMGKIFIFRLVPDAVFLFSIYLTSLA